MQDCSSVLCCGVDACVVKKKAHHNRATESLTHQTLLARSFFFLLIMDGSFLNKTTLATASFVQRLQFFRWDTLVVVWIFACLLTFMSSQYTLRQRHTETQRERERDRERGGWFAFWIAITKAIRFRG
jgi:hypothetical protein